MELRQRLMGLRQLTDPDRAGGYVAVQNVQRWIVAQLLLWNTAAECGPVVDDWGFLQGTVSFERDGFLFDLCVRAVPKPCRAHAWPRALRCVHKGDEFVVLRPTDDPEEWEVTYGHSLHEGSITSPIDNARKNWAFDQTVRRYLKGEGV